MQVCLFTNIVSYLFQDNVLPKNSSSYVLLQLAKARTHTKNGLQYLSTEVKLGKLRTTKLMQALLADSTQLHS